MNSFLHSFKRAMLDCEIFRNGEKIANQLGLVNDNKEYNYIAFDPNIDIQIGDEIYCPIKKKHYLVNYIDIKTFNGKAHRLEAYFDNNYINSSQTTIFNTYNPNNTIIGNQDNAVINIRDSFNHLENLIKQNENEDTIRLNELYSILKEEIQNNNLSKSKLSKFGDLLCKYSWLAPAISQIIVEWIKKG